MSALVKEAWDVYVDASLDTSKSNLDCMRAVLEVAIDAALAIARSEADGTGTEADSRASRIASRISRMLQVTQQDDGPYTVNRIKQTYTASRIKPTCSICGEEGHRWQRCSEMNVAP